MIKNTKKRNLVIDILSSNKLPMSAEQIFKLASLHENINLSTIYRNLNKLIEGEIIKKEIQSDGIAYFKINDHIHKHHLTCKSCGNIAEIDNCPFDTIAENIKKETGYTVTDHNLGITGICPKCNNKTNI